MDVYVPKGARVTGYSSPDPPEFASLSGDLNFLDGCATARDFEFTSTFRVTFRKEGQWLSLDPSECRVFLQDYKNEKVKTTKDYRFYQSCVQDDGREDISRVISSEPVCICSGDAEMDVRESVIKAANFVLNLAVSAQPYLPSKRVRDPKSARDTSVGVWKGSDEHLAISRWLANDPGAVYVPPDSERADSDEKLAGLSRLLADEHCITSPSAEFEPPVGPPVFAMYVGNLSSEQIRNEIKLQQGETKDEKNAVITPAKNKPEWLNLVLAEQIQQNTCFYLEPGSVYAVVQAWPADPETLGRSSKERRRFLEVSQYIDSVIGETHKQAVLREGSRQMVQDRKGFGQKASRVFVNGRFRVSKGRYEI